MLIYRDDHITYKKSLNFSHFKLGPGQVHESQESAHMGVTNSVDLNNESGVTRRC